MIDDIPEKLGNMIKSGGKQICTRQMVLLYVQIIICIYKLD
jgi:hypothetical protein